MKMIILLLSLFASASVQAALYKYTNDQGETVYSDKAPYDGATEVKLPPLQTTPAVKYTAPKKAPESTDNEPASPKPVPYTRLKITRPENGKAMRNNAGLVKVQLSIKPKLNTKIGDRIDYLLDGKIIKKGSKLSSLTIKNMERGEHRLKVRIRNKQGKVIKSSDTITFVLHRYSRLHKTGPQ